MALNIWSNIRFQHENGQYQTISINLIMVFLIILLNGAFTPLKANTQIAPPVSQQTYGFAKSAFVGALALQHLALSIKASGYSCQISQAKCNNYSNITGVFNDDYNGSGSNQAACMQRAEDYHVWCGNPSQIMTTASFFENGAHRESRVAGTLCQISQGQCNNFPDVKGTFADDYNGSGANKAVCMARANDYSTWCGNPSSVQTTAIFFENGVSKEARVVGTGCQISQTQCNNHPEMVGIFADDHNGSGSNQAACMQRADDYHSWCGNPQEIVTTAVYTENGTVKSSKEVGSHNFCQITQSQCNNYPNVKGTFSDNYNGSGENQAICMQRADDYHSWCGNPNEVTTSATFFSYGSAKETRVVGQPPTVPPKPVETDYFSAGNLNLTAGQAVFLRSVHLLMQSDGNFVVYKNYSPVWSSGTYGRDCSGCVARFQGDGNLVLYDGNGQPFWNSGSQGNGNVYLKLATTFPYLQIIRDGGTAWSSSPVENFEPYNVEKLKLPSNRTYPDRIVINKDTAHDGMVIEGKNIGNSGHNGPCITIRGMNNITIQANEIFDCANDNDQNSNPAIDIQDSTNIRIIGNFIHNHKGLGVYIHNSRNG